MCNVNPLLFHIVSQQKLVCMVAVTIHPKMWVLLCICFAQHILKIEPEDFHVVYAVYR
jgi:hypothetical protein